VELYSTPLYTFMKWTDTIFTQNVPATKINSLMAFREMVLFIVRLA